MEHHTRTAIPNMSQERALQRCCVSIFEANMVNLQYDSAGLAFSFGCIRLIGTRLAWNTGSPGTELPQHTALQNGTRRAINRHAPRRQLERATPPTGTNIWRKPNLMASVNDENSLRQ